MPHGSRTAEVEDAERIPSPDGAYTIFLVPIEMKMSHWLAQPLIIETEMSRTLFDLTDTSWSADAVRWSDDSARVALDMRRYPGDAPGLTATIDLYTRTAAIASSTDTATLPLDALPGWLEGYYERHRRRT
jgi:hypothetical protein